MTTIEDQLRDAYRAAAGTVQPDAITPLPDSLAGPRHGVRSADRPVGRRMPRHWSPGLSLGAAAAAAAVIVATAIAVPRIWPGQAGRGASLALSQGPAPAAAFPGGQLPGGTPPRYLAAVVNLNAPAPSGATALKIISTSTGAVTAQLAAPRTGMYYQAVAALGSDDQFVAAATRGRAAGSSASCTTWLYQFRLDAAGQPVGLRPLSVPEVAGLQQPLSLTASANGKVIAFNTSRCTNARQKYRFPGQVGAIDLTTGAVSTWTYRWPAQQPAYLSLSADGSLLSMIASPSNAAARDQTNAFNSVWVLPTSSPAGPLSRHYRQVIEQPARPQSATLSPNGAVIFALTAVKPAGRPFFARLAAYSAATGRRIAVLYQLSHQVSLSMNQVVATSNSGRYLLLGGWNARAQRLDLATGRVAQIPGHGNWNPLSLAW